MFFKEPWKRRATRFLFAQTVSLFGSSIVQYAMIWYITLNTSSGAAMTVSVICGYVPQILISLFAGAWLDRHDRKKMMIYADAGIAGVTLVTALCFMSGAGSLWLIYVTLALRSIGAGIQTPAVQSFLPQIVEKEHLAKVNGVNATLSALMSFLAPAFSGVILSLTSIQTTFFIDVATAVVGIGITLGIVVPAGSTFSAGQKTSVLQDILAGMRYVTGEKQVKHLMLYMLTTGILAIPASFLTPLLVSRVFGSEVWRLSLSQTLYSLGAILGGVLITSWGGLSRRGQTILLTGFVYGSLTLCMGLAPSYAFFLGVQFCLGVCVSCYITSLSVLVQETVRPEMLGRVFSMVQITNSCAYPLGSLVFGPLADVLSVQALLLIAGPAVVLLAGTFWQKKLLLQPQMA